MSDMIYRDLRDLQPGDTVWLTGPNGQFAGASTVAEYPATVDSIKRSDTPDVWIVSIDGETRTLPNILNLIVTPATPDPSGRMATAPEPNPAYREITWPEFRSTGALTFVNSFLHIFGLAIVVESDAETGECKRAYPARTVFRGFPRETMDRAYANITAWMQRSSDELAREVSEE